MCRRRRRSYLNSQRQSRFPKKTFFFNFWWCEGIPILGAAPSLCAPGILPCRICQIYSIGSLLATTERRYDEKLQISAFRAVDQIRVCAKFDVSHFGIGAFRCIFLEYFWLTTKLSTTSAKREAVGFEIHPLWSVKVRPHAKMHEIPPWKCEINQKNAKIEISREPLGIF